MDEVDSGPSWATWRARKKSTDQEPERQQNQHKQHVTLYQSEVKYSSHDQESYRSSRSLSTSLGACHSSNDTDSSGSSGAYKSSLYFSTTQRRPFLETHLVSSSQSDFLTQDDLDTVAKVTSNSPVKNDDPGNTQMMRAGDETSRIVCIKPVELHLLLKAGLEKYLLIDSRSFLEFNTSHIQQSTNVCCSRLVKRRLQRDKVFIRDLLTQTCHIDIDEFDDVIVYDQVTEDPGFLSDDTFLWVLLQKLATTFNRVSLLKGGFLAFQAMYPSLCESKTNNYRCAALTSLSQPCLPVSNVGPTRILPFLYLGSQQDALSQDTVQVNEITYVLNVSTTCIKPPYIPDGHFLRIPVNDNYSAKLSPYFSEAFQFLDKVREANGCCLVHCLAGISRSPTLAIAYIMKHLNMSSDDAYRYVKDKRPTISPNFNFLGQLLEFEKKLKQEREMNNNTDGALSQRLDSRHWSNYVMDLSSHSPSSPVAKSIRPFVFDTSPHGQFPTRKQKTRDTKTDQTKAAQCNESEPKSEVQSDRAISKVDNMTFKQPLAGLSKAAKPELTLYSQKSPFPCSKESKVRPNVLNLGCDTTRRAPTMYGKETNNSMSKSLTDITEMSESESPSPSVMAKSQEQLLTTSSVITESRNVAPLLSPFPCGESTIKPLLSPFPCGESTIKPLLSPFPCGDTTVHSFSMDQHSTVRSASTSGNLHTNTGTKDCTSDKTHHKSHCFEVTTSASQSSLSESKVSHVTSPSPCKNFSLSLSETIPQTRGKRPQRSSLSLSLTPVTPSRSPVRSVSDSGYQTSSVYTDKDTPSPQKMDTNFGSDIPNSSNIPSFPSPLPKSTPPFCGTGSVTMSHVVKLKSFLLSSSTPSLSMLAQSPTSSLAKLHFGNTDSSDSDNDVIMTSSRSGSNSPSHEHRKINHKAHSETLERLNFYSFPSTSLDKLNFTPCLSNSSESIQSGSAARTSGVKRPLNLDPKESDLESVGSLNSSINSSSNNSSVSSPTSAANPPKVVVRKREGRAKRTLVRPNSIAFSSYPTFDLGSEGQDSPNSGSSTTSQDDSSESFIQNGKKSKPSDYMTDVRFRLGRYSEREMYRQITAVMETAMLKTQVYEASRKSRSLDDILSSEDDNSAPNCESSMFDRVLRHCGLNRDRYTSPSLLLENHACGSSHGSGDHYHSNSSLSSTGSHTSLHSSMELIQVS